MAIELKVPEIGESITEVEIGEWLKKSGEAVKRDEPLVTLESDKATVELPSPGEGTLTKTLKKKGDIAKVGEVIGYLENGAAASSPAKPEGKTSESKAPEKSSDRKAETPREPAPTAKPARSAPPSPERPQNEPQARSAPALAVDHTEAAAQPGGSDGEEDVVPMSRLRRTVAERLVAAQRNAALLTTFNEIDMGQVMALRKQYGDGFQQKYGVKLGFMSFFVKACVDALKQFPTVNAEVRGTDIVYHNFYDIGVAIGSGKGLVVPVLRHAERLSFAEVEKAIGDFGVRARENKLKPDELQGGTFTISNGGVYGSLLSTPIVNPPQSGVLGMHSIQDRPVAREGSVVIRPMMYVALSYDHRIVDGREAVTFLKRVKDTIENPARMLMEV